MTGKSIKINVVEGHQREHLWATMIDDDLAQIDNIPFLSETVSFHDVVRYCPKYKMVLQVVEPSGFKNGAVAYHGERDEYYALSEALSHEGIHTEGMVPGVCAIAYPKTMERSVLKKIVENAGAMVVSRDEVKLSVIHAGNTQGCACCGTKLKYDNIKD